MSAPASGTGTPGQAARSPGQVAWEYLATAGLFPTAQHWQHKPQHVRDLWEGAVAAAAAAQPANGDGCSSCGRPYCDDCRPYELDSLVITSGERDVQEFAAEQPAPEVAATGSYSSLWKKYNDLREAARELASQVQASADATRPSKKTSIEDEIAIALRKLTEGK